MTFRRVIASGLILALIGAAGIWIAWRQAPFAFSLGDNSFFHVMAVWLGRGETYLKDFTHFRTPGAYYFYEAMQRLFGVSFRTTAFAILLETFLFQPVCSFLLAAAATRVILGRTSLVIATACGVSFFFLLPIFQLRTAVPSAAFAAYLLTLLPEQDLRARSRSLLLALTGGLLGLSYWAGEETFFLAIYAMALGELVHCRRNWTLIFSRLALIALPAALVIGVPLLWLALNGLDLGRYFYYTAYYALVVQPVGLNLPFPLPHWPELLTHYAPFILLAVVCGIFAARNRFDAASLALLSFACLRMVSGLGRADLWHVAFSISELVVVLPIAIALLLQPAPRWSVGALVGVVVAVLFGLGMFVSASILLAIPPVLVLASRLKPIPVPFHMVAAVGGVAILLASQYPGALDRLRDRFIFVPEPKSYSYSGAVLTKGQRQELRAAAALVEAQKITSLFAFPLIPEYYTFVDGHPTNITYFEAQIRPSELQQTIAELQAAHPQAVFEAFDQAVASSRYLYPLADYISSAYVTTTVIDKGRSIEVRTPRSETTFVSRLADRLYAANPGASAGTARLQRLTWIGVPLPVIEAIQPLRFDYPAGTAGHLTLRLLPRPDGSPARATVEVVSDGSSTSRDIYSTGDTTVLDVDSNGGSFSIVLHPQADGSPSDWVNAEITGS